MKNSILFCALTLAAAPLLAADSGPKEEITAAAKKLTDKGNYGWRTTVVVPESSQFKPGPTDGKTEKGGWTHVRYSFGENTNQFFIKGDKAALTNPDGGWQTLAETENSEGFGRFMAIYVRNFKTPADQVIELATFAKGLKKEGEAYVSDLTEDGAKTMLTFRRGTEGPTVSNPKGSVKIWLKNGLVSKYEFKLTGSMDFNGNTFDMDRTSTVEIKDVGTTKISIPDEAKKKLS